MMSIALGCGRRAIETGVEYIDVELVAWEKNKMLRDRISEAAEKNGTKIILTNHSFEGRPKDLEQRIARLRRIKQADVLKIAWKAESIMDAVDALRLTAKIRAEDGRPAVAIAMGEEGIGLAAAGEKIRIALHLRGTRPRRRECAGPADDRGVAGGVSLGGIAGGFPGVRGGRLAHRA